MNVLLAKIELSAEAIAAANDFSDALRKPSEVRMNASRAILLSLADETCRVMVSWEDWFAAIVRVHDAQPDFTPGLLLPSPDIELLLAFGVPDAARSVLVTARESGSAILQCFPEDEE